MSPRTRILLTSGRAPSTASRASRLLWTSERRASVGGLSFPPSLGEGGVGALSARSGVDAFVSVDEENAQRGGDRNRDEEPEDTSQIAPDYERDDDEHRAQGDRVAECLRGKEGVHDGGGAKVQNTQKNDSAP